MTKLYNFWTELYNTKLVLSFISLITIPILPLAIIALFSKKCFYYKGCKNVPELLLPEIKTKNGFP